MANQYYACVCQWCGRSANPGSAGSNGGPPIQNPTIPGKCPSHPSGAEAGPHSPKWEQRG